YKHQQEVVQTILDKMPYHCLSVCTKNKHHTAENIARGIDNIMHEVGIDKF
ncbi:2236_t:CDS:2, partial [Dentiscutata heterogama]